MNSIEKSIIGLIQNNKYLSEELKKRYIVALFLMEYEKQEEFLKLMEAFTRRCQETDRGIFIVHPNEMGSLIRTYDEAKNDVLKKLNTNNLNSNGI